MSAGPARPRLLYHVIAAADWAAAEARGVYEGSPACRADGFIHLSTAAQLPGTLARFFAGATDLVLIRVAAAALGPALRWEEVPGEGLFPHLYAPLDPARARLLGPIRLGADATHLLPALEPVSGEVP